MTGSGFIGGLLAALIVGGALGAAHSAHAADKAGTIVAAPFNRSGDLGYWAAVDQGFFREAGVDVKSEALETRVLARDAVTSGSVDISHVSINTSLRAFEAKEPVKVVAQIFPRYPIIVIVRPDILKEAGLTEDAFHKLDAAARFALIRDKRIALTAAGGLEDQTLRAQLKAIGETDADGFAQIQYVQSYGALEASFLQGRVDAIVSDAANGKWFSSKGQGVQLLTGDEQDRYLPATVIPAGAWIVNTDWLAKDGHDKVLRGFLSAWVRGNKWVAGLPSDRFRDWILGGFPEVKDPTAQDKLVLTAEINRAQTAIDGRLDAALLKRVVDFALDQKTIRAAVDENTIYTWEYLP